jgi:hypothetical protein
VTFDDLIEGTAYRFRVFAWDNAGNRIKSQLVTARTSGTPPPRLDDISVTERTMYGGKIRWITNLETKSVLEAGHDTPLKFTTEHDSFSKFHQVNLTRFYPNQPLYYRITITDSRGETTATNVRSFRTLEANFALNKPVEGNFDTAVFGVSEEHYGKTPFLERVNDGNYSYSKGTANSRDPADTAQYFIINLQQLIKPGRAEVYWRDLAYPKEYEIWGSKFKRNWVKLADDINAADGEHELTPIGNMKAYINTVHFPDTAPEIQFVKLRIPKGASYYGHFPSYNFVQLFEFKIFPDDVSRPGPEILREDPTSSSASTNRDNRRTVPVSLKYPVTVELVFNRLIRAEPLNGSYRTKITLPGGDR